MKKIVFTDKQISEIEKDYLINNLSCETIGKKFGISKRPINNLLKKNGKLKKGLSNGKKINLTDEQVKTIKKLYLEELRTGPYIAKIFGENNIKECNIKICEFILNYIKKKINILPNKYINEAIKNVIIYEDSMRRTLYV
jgi:predicted DNA-binding protein YlxM (UPF0122 family)